MSTLRLILFTIAALTFAARPARADDHSDSRDGATPLPIDGTPVQGVIDPPDDQDWFSVNAQAGHVYVVHVDAVSPDFYPLADFFAPDSQVPYYHYSSEEQDPPGLIRPTVSGLYAVRVTSFYEIGVYQVRVTDLGIVQDDYGDTEADANLIPTDGADIHGAINFNYDADAFRFSLSERTLYSLELRTETHDTFLDADLIPSGGRYPVLSVLNSNFGGSPFVFQTQIVAVPTGRGGAYWLQIHQYSGAIANPGPYAFRVREIGPMQPDDHADNRDDATLVTPGPGGVNGVIDEHDDTDWFAFQAQQSRLYRIEVGPQNNGSSIVLDFAVYPPGVDDPLVTARTWPSDFVEIITPTDGLYAIRVSGGQDFVQTFYSVRITDLGIVPDDHPGGPESAAPIAADGSLTTGTVDYSQDADYFRVTLAEQTAYAMEVRSIEPCIQTRAVLSPAGSSDLIAGCVHEFDCSAEDGLAWFTLGAGQSGDYIVRVDRPWPEIPDVSHYALRLYPLGTAAPDDHGDDCDHATPLTLGAPPVFGISSGNSDIDFFTFPGVPGRIYQVTVEPHNSYADIRTSVFAPGCSRLLDQSRMNHIVFAARAAGQHAIRVSSSGYDPVNTAYEVSVADMGPGADDYGNTPADSSPITTDGTALNGLINWPADHDVFSVFMQDRNTYRIELDAEPCADVWLSLLGPDGLSQLLHIEAIDPGCRTSPHAESTFYVPGYAGGVLSLDVVGYGGFLRPPTQSYTVRVTRESCPADVNTDGVLDPLDLFEFLDAFFAGAPDGDFNCDRTLNSQDFYDFLNAYLLGC